VGVVDVFHRSDSDLQEKFDRHLADYKHAHSQQYAQNSTKRPSGVGPADSDPTIGPAVFDFAARVCNPCFTKRM
jgi:hypothetical protein